ncbi:MAG: MFS transporter, partial [Bacteroidota bacterium]
MAELYVLTVGVTVFGVFELLALSMQKTQKSKSGLAEIVNDFNMMPKAMKQLAIVQFFSWFSLFAVWIYSVAGITSHTYDMKIDHGTFQELNQSIEHIPQGKAEKYEDIDKIVKSLSGFENKLQTQDHVVTSMRVVKFFADEERAEDLELSDITHQRMKTIQKEYNTGADWVGVGFAVYNGFAAVFAFFLIFLAKITNRKITHMIALGVGGISLISLYFIQSTGIPLLIPFVGIGLTWASILAMPYAILTSTLPSHKMGVYMGIFNFFIVIPQILAASVLGFLVKSIFNEQPIYALVLGGATWFLAAALMPFVHDRHEDEA